MPEEKVSQQKVQSCSCGDDRCSYDAKYGNLPIHHAFLKPGYISAELPAVDAGPRQVKCPFCENGQRPITIEMAIDAGHRNMAGGTTTCGNCGGDGWVITPPVPQEAAPDDDLIGKVDSKHLNDWATAPDEAMRVAVEQIQDAIGSIRVDGSLSVSDEWLAALIREAGSERERRLTSVLFVIMSDMPKKRDWLDPDIEREASRLLGGE